MHATEYTLPRRPAAPQALGTPVTSLPGATRVDEVPTPAPPADADEGRADVASVRAKLSKLSAKKPRKSEVA